MRVQALCGRRVSRGAATAALGVVMLNLVDAFGTLRHIEYGAEELNPLMTMLLRHGPLCFLLAKHLLASVGVVGIAAYGEVPIARFALRWLLLPLYLGIASYQVALFFVVR